MFVLRLQKRIIITKFVEITKWYGVKLITLVLRSNICLINFHVYFNRDRFTGGVQPS